MSAATATAVVGRHFYSYPPNVKDSGGNGSYLDVDDIVSAFDRSKFRRLVKKWRNETYLFSTVKAKTQHPAFEEIVNMGETAVPWIIQEMRTHRDFLFMALHFILEEDPTVQCQKGKPIEQIEAWLLWAERENIEN